MNGFLNDANALSIYFMKRARVIVSSNFSKLNALFSPRPNAHDFAEPHVVGANSPFGTMFRRLTYFPPSQYIDSRCVVRFRSIDWQGGSGGDPPPFLFLDPLDIFQDLQYKSPKTSMLLDLANICMFWRSNRCFEYR